MYYFYNSKKDVYVINLIDIKKNNEFQNILREISLMEIRNDNYQYNTYFNKDYTGCIVDFNRQSFTQDDIENIINNENERRR